MRWTEILMASINKCKSEVYPLEHISKTFLNFSMLSSGREDEDFFFFLALSIFQYALYALKLSTDPPHLKRITFSLSYLFLIVITPSI